MPSEKNINDMIEELPRVERGDYLADGHIPIVEVNVMSMVMMRILRTVMLMLFRELALAEVEVFKVLDHIKAEESSGNLYK